ncbi:MAG: cupin domain-containing protein [Planctomycetes bacterium]|nr:cupin domain-containing protein [Planctomycetota bacterium]
MKHRRLKSHPDFKLEGRSRHFQSFWELELTPGEETNVHQHYESEELICVVSGHGTIAIDKLERVLAPGEVALVPPRTDHVIKNLSDDLVRAVTIESRFDLGLGDHGLEEATSGAVIAASEARARDSVQTIEELMRKLPARLDEASAIHTILSLFDIGGNLSEEIEGAIGLDNARGLEALTAVELRIMEAVVEISGRYRRRSGRFFLDG